MAHPVCDKPTRRAMLTSLLTTNNLNRHVNKSVVQASLDAMGTNNDDGTAEDIEAKKTALRAKMESANP